MRNQGTWVWATWRSFFCVALRQAIGQIIAIHRKHGHLGPGTMPTAPSGVGWGWHLGKRFYLLPLPCPCSDIFPLQESDSWIPYRPHSHRDVYLSPRKSNFHRREETGLLSICVDSVNDVHAFFKCSPQAVDSNFLLLTNSLGKVHQWKKYDLVKLM